MKSLVIIVFIFTALAGCDGGKIDVPPNGVGTGSGNNQTENGGSNSGGSTSPGPTTTTGDVIASLNVEHRSGQTFLDWLELGNADYHVYRHNAPISNANLANATRLTQKWGPLDSNTSINSNASSATPGNFVIKDLGQPLADNRGLFVHTTQNNQQGSAYYAVTVVNGGVENTNIVAGRNATTNAMNESVSTPRPVLTVSNNGGKGRIYTQYMDYTKWNPTFNGYAFNFAVALPQNYNSANAYPLMVELHAYGEQHKFVNQSEYNWSVIQLFPSDPGSANNKINTWWYGHAADHNYLTQGQIPRSGTIENFTEQRVIAAVNFLISDGQFNVNRELIHSFGHSMGASGAVALGMRYPSLFAGIYASQPMTNYGTSPIFQSELVQLWGERSANLSIANNGQNNADIRNYGVGGSQVTGVWNWMNHQEQLVRRRAERFSYLMVDHGKADAVIDWQTQGRPMAKAFTDARVGFSAAAVGNAGHSWLGFNSVVSSMFGLAGGNDAGWWYPRSLSFPGIHNASGSGTVPPANAGDDLYNTTIEWSTPRNNFHQNIVDSANRYEISIRSMSVNQTADITPRNTNSFKPTAGQQCSWNAKSNSNNASLGAGTATVDGSRLLTIPRVQIVTGNGTRLVVNCR